MVSLMVRSLGTCKQEENIQMSNNVKTEIKGNLLVITVDVSKATIEKSQYSKTGKNKLVASTGGFESLGNGLSLGLNVISR